MKIFLIGYMGCGKSTIGRELARRRKVAFRDMDTLAEQACGESIRAFFAHQGEEAFRRCERQILEEEVQRPDEAVIATGGGVPCFFDNVEVMNQAGLTVYFKMSPEKLASRLKFGRAKRPLLQDKSDEELVAFIREGLAQRESFYLQAKLVIDCDGVSDDYIAEHVQHYLELADEMRAESPSL